MMNFATLSLHPDFPAKVWVVVEQPRDEPYRIAYDALTHTFSKTKSRFLLHARGFRGVYGWIAGTGLPPEPHYDVMLLTTQEAKPGTVLEGFICGAFFRADGDHKFVAVDIERRAQMASADLAALDACSYAELLALYPHAGEGEGWRGSDIALDHLRQHKPTHD